MTNAMRSVLLSVVLVLGLAQAVSAEPIRVGSVTVERANSTWTLDGSNMANTRAKLLNPANFGPAGRVARQVLISDTGATITAGLLSSFDVFFIGYLPDSDENAFSAGELSAFSTWVNGGGTMVITCDETGYDAVCAHFGYPAFGGNVSTNPIVANAAGAVHPLFSGPFGTFASVNMNGTKGAFATTAGATLLARESGDDTLPTILVKNVGLGRIILLADVDLLANAATDGPDITSNNDRFIGNVFAFAGGVAINYQGLWWKRPAGSEAGWGVNLNHQGDTIFATWFTYNFDGDPWWLASVATRTGPGVYEGALFTTTGPAFNAVPFDPAQIVETNIGTAKFEFSGYLNGVFTYTVSSAPPVAPTKAILLQSKEITRQHFAEPVPNCTWGEQPDLSIATNYQDLWWKSTESGWGINFTHQGDIIFATWFTYDTEGKPWWLAVSATKTGDNVYSGDLFTTKGPAFNAVPFNPDNVVETTVGTATFTILDGQNVVFNYTVNGVTQAKVISRQVFAGSGTLCN